MKTTSHNPYGHPPTAGGVHSALRRTVRRGMHPTRTTARRGARHATRCPADQPGPGRLGAERLSESYPDLPSCGNLRQTLRPAVA
jgi:hypothetical protein